MRFGIAPPLSLALAVVSAATTAVSGGPSREALTAWATYAGAVDTRVERELKDSRRFLALDFAADPSAHRRAVLAGEVVVRRLDAVEGAGRNIDVPSALVHHWTGAILIPGLQIDALLQSLQRDVPDMGQSDVLESRVLTRGPDEMTVFLKLQRTRFVTAVFNTEHRVQFRRYSPERAFSTSTATKIAELDAPGTPQERERAPGDDRGFLWRWNAYWRYERVSEGVIVE